ncbi:MAG: peptidylprolyl isomerase [Myxococcales bacterium]|nr:peptidylprolyl isomerase [Myxococcales bacterium]
MTRPALALLVALVGCTLASTAAAEIIDRVVAVVDDEVISLSELEDAARPLLAQVDAVSDPVTRTQLRDRQLRAALDGLIGKMLVAQEAARRNLGVERADVDAHIERVRARQGWTEDQLRLYLQGQGLSLAEFRAEIRENLLRQRVIGAVLGSKIRIGESDLRDYYKEKLTRSNTEYEVEAAHIVLSVPENATPAEEAAVRQQATEILQRARSGEGFADLARRYSQGPGASEGGYLGTIRRGSIDGSIEQAIFALAPGEVGGPVRSPFGYHVVTVLDRKKLPPQPYEEIKEDLRRELHEKRLEEELGKWIDELKKKSFVDIRL